MTRSDGPSETMSTRRSSRLANIAEQRRTELRREDEEAKTTRPIRSSKQCKHKHSTGKPRRAKGSSTSKSQSGMTSDPPKQYSAETALIHLAPAPYALAPEEEPQSEHFHSHRVPTSTAQAGWKTPLMDSTARSGADTANDANDAIQDTAWTHTSIGSSAIQAAYVSPYPGSTGESWEFLKVDFVGLPPTRNWYNMQPSETDGWWDANAVQYGEPSIPIDPALCMHGPPVFQAPSCETMKPTSGPLNAGLSFWADVYASVGQDLSAAELGLIDPNLEQHFSQQTATDGETGAILTDFKENPEEPPDFGRPNHDENWLEVLRKNREKSSQTAFCAFEDGDGLLRVA